MEKEQQEQVNYSADLPENYTGLDYSLDHNPPQLMKPQTGENSVEHNLGMVDYMFNNPAHLQQSSPFATSTSLDKLNFSEVMQFADFGPKLALNQTKATDEENGIDPVYFLKFPVLNDRLQNQNLMSGAQSAPPLTRDDENEFGCDGEENRGSGNKPIMHHGFSLDGLLKNPSMETKNRRKRPRSVKTSEEVESQRMTHIAVERNRRKQMNEHLRVLRSLMPGSYVQRGDQASIIGGAIEFVRELEQLLQCLESQKRRRLYGTSDTPRPITDPAETVPQLPDLPYSFPPMPVPNEQIKFGDYDTGLLEDTAENKSCLADVEVKVLGFDALIKILSRRRPGQLIKTIEALEDLQFIILHTNITTIEQTVLYTFNVKVASESAFTAEDIASSVQQIFGFIHASSGI